MTYYAPWVLYGNTVSKLMQGFRKSLSHPSEQIVADMRLAINSEFSTYCYHEAAIQRSTNSSTRVQQMCSTSCWKSC